MAITASRLDQSRRPLLWLSQARPQGEAAGADIIGLGAGERL